MLVLCETINAGLEAWIRLYRRQAPGQKRKLAGRGLEKGACALRVPCPRLAARARVSVASCSQFAAALIRLPPACQPVSAIAKGAREGV